MKNHANPVTDEDADKFADYMNYWQQELGLMDWRIVRSPKRAANAMAEVAKRDVEARLASYRIGSHFGSQPVTDKALSSTACHEALHILLAELIEAVKADIKPELIMAAEHRVVHTLERLLVK